MTKNKAPPKERTGLDNLTEQIDRIWRGLNQKGYATRSKYYDCTIRFCRYYYEHWHGQKFANISGKHIRGYVEYMQNVKHYAPKTITAELSGIRFYYNAAGGRNNLPTNDTLGLEKNITGVIDRAWLPEEFISAVGLARSMNREDVVIALKSCYSFGFRIHEVCKLRVEQIENAVKYGEISVKGKGGQVRAIPIETDRQKKMITELLEYARKKGLQPGQYFISNDKSIINEQFTNYNNTFNQLEQMAPKFMGRQKDKRESKSIDTGKWISRKPSIIGDQSYIDDSTYKFIASTRRINNFNSKPLIMLNYVKKEPEKIIKPENLLEKPLKIHMLLEAINESPRKKKFSTFKIFRRNKENRGNRHSKLNKTSPNQFSVEKIQSEIESNSNLLKDNKY